MERGSNRKESGITRLVCHPPNLRLRNQAGSPLFLSPRRGCSSVVEHLLAKEDVASSSLVTRSSLRLSYGESEDWSECAVARRRRTALFGEATAGKPSV